MPTHAHILGLRLPRAIAVDFDTQLPFARVVPESSPLELPLRASLDDEPFEELWARCGDTAEAQTSDAALWAPLVQSGRVVTASLMGRAFKDAPWLAVDSIVTAIRLVLDAEVTRGAFAVNDFDDDGDPEYTSWSQIQDDHVPATEPLVLNENDADELQRAIADVAALGPRLRVGDLAIALRYFERSFGTDLPSEDRVLNLVIALEALLSPSSKDELKNRVSTRAARLVGRDAAEAQRIQAVCGWAYDVRSAVAHGVFDGFREKDWKKALAFAPSSLRDGGVSQASSDLRRIVRLVLVRRCTLDLDKSALGETLDAPLETPELSTLRDGTEEVPVCASAWLTR
jgi:hypothetical protein